MPENFPQRADKGTDTRRSAQPFQENVVLAAAAAIHADLNLVFSEKSGKSLPGSRLYKVVLNADWVISASNIEKSANEARARILYLKGTVMFEDGRREEAVHL